MSPVLLRLTKILAFVALFAFLDRALDATHFRASLLNAFVDSLSMSLGIASKYIDWTLVTLAAAGMLATLTTLFRALTSGLRR
ncbi:MAG: hypothetical protein LAP40_02470 [Acidobacteriia bacterium]|nr:hypothetical protein [Terriglobia bacterium]